MKQLRKWMVRIVRGTALVAIFALGLTALANLFDSDLHPDLAAQPAPAGGKPSAADNLYFFTLGFFAPEDDNPQLYGRNEFFYNVSRWRDYRYSTSWYKESFYGEKKLREIATAVETCRTTTSWRCLEDPEIDHFVPDERLLRRYRRLFTSQAYWEEEAFAPPQHAMIYGMPGPMTVQPMHLTKVALDYKKGQRVQALKALRRDVGFTRKQLAGVNSSFMFLVAIQMLKRDYLLLSELLSTEDVLSAEEKSEIRKMAVPLTPAELPVARVLDGVSRQRLHVLLWTHGAMTRTADPTLLDGYRILGENDDLNFFPTRSVVYNFALSPLLKVNESANARYDLVKREKNRWNSRKDGFDPSPVSEDPGLLARTFSSMLFIRNPVGKILMKRDQYDAPSWFMKTALDTDGYIKLVTLKARWRIADEGVGDFVKFAASQNDLFDPYTGLPMQWNGMGFFFSGKDPRALEEGLDAVAVLRNP